MLRGSLLLLGFFVTALSCFGVDRSRVTVARPGDWVVERSIEISAPLERTGGNQGFVYHLIDSQVHAELAASYARNVYQITSGDGVQAMSQVAVSFDPEYERIEFHQIRVTRNGVSSDRLNLDAMQLIQQERDLERFQYNGQYTALFLLQDTRVGDIVEYAFTRHGRNPVFGNSFGELQFENWNVPIQRHHIRFLVSPDRPFQWKHHGPPILAHSVQSQGTLVAHEWQGESLKAVEFEANAPGWHTPVSFLQMTDFAGWSDVVDWALPLYGSVDTGRDLRAEAKRAGGNSVRSKETILRLLDFVQQEVRYLGMELGPRSHAPNAPDQVLKARYGDCKDKSRLLCALLREYGIEAVPALVHSSRGRTLEQWLPSLQAFDHVIVRITVAGQVYWVDPTLTDQGGDLAYRALPNYVWALPISAGVTRLERVRSEELMRRQQMTVSASEDAVVQRAAQGITRSEIELLETYKFGKPGEPVELEVQSTYRGLAADGLRGFLRRTPPEQIAKHFFNVRAKTQPSVEAVGVPAWNEYAVSNEIRVTHSYRIPDFWVKDSSSPVLKAEFYPWLVNDYVTAPETLKRTSPQAVAHPLRMVNRMVVHLPDEWAITPERHVVEDAVFTGVSEVSYGEKTLKLKYEYVTLGDSIEASRMQEYAARLAEFRGLLGYSLTYNPEIAARNATFRLNWTYVAVAVLSLGGTIWFSLWLSRRDWGIHRVPVVSPPANLTGLGGWLVLVGFGISARTVVQLVSVARDYGGWFDARLWEGQTAGMHALAIIEFVLNVGMLGLYVVVAVTYFRKQRLFPLIFVVASGTTFVGSLLMVALGSALTDLPAEFAGETARGLVQLVISSCIWIPYMFTSRRVKATFVRPPRRNVAPTEPPPLDVVELRDSTNARVP